MYVIVCGSMTNFPGSSSEIWIQPALMMYRKFYTAFFCYPYHVIQFFQTHCHRFLANDIFPGTCCLNHKIMMLIIVRRNQNNLYIRITKQLFIGAVPLQSFLHIFELLRINI